MAVQRWGAGLGRAKAIQLMNGTISRKDVRRVNTLKTDPAALLARWRQKASTTISSGMMDR